MGFWVNVVLVVNIFDSCWFMLLVFDISVGVFKFMIVVLYSFDIFELMFSIFEFSVLMLRMFEFVFVNVVCVWFY